MSESNKTKPAINNRPKEKAATRLQDLLTGAIIPLPKKESNTLL